MKKINLFFISILIVLLMGGFIYYGFLIPVGKEKAPDPKMREIITRGKILVGTEAAYPPMEFLDEAGNFLGFDIDLAKEIAFDLGVGVEFKNIPWAEIFDSVIEGKVDMIISAITITPERMEFLSFSDPYFNTGQVIVGQKDSLIKGIEDLQGKALGVQEGTTSEEEAKKYTGPFLVKSYANYTLAKEALFQGEIEAIIIDYPAGLGMVAEDENLKIIGEPFTQEFYGVAVQKGQEVLLTKINQTIRRLKQTRELKVLEEKWLTR
jgi:polar amino acid transport system substrate-binding protein